jgi:hypothetical protein
MREFLPERLACSAWPPAPSHGTTEMVPRSDAPTIRE